MAILAVVDVISRVLNRASSLLVECISQLRPVVAAEDTCVNLSSWTVLLVFLQTSAASHAKLPPRTNKSDKHWKSLVRFIDMDPGGVGGGGY